MKSLSSNKIRRLALILSVLLFPVTMVYFSPGMVFRGARLGILSGSYITFFILFMCAIIFGRLWCAWLCPAGGLCEIVGTVNSAPYKYNRLKWVKYIIWSIWLIAIAAIAILIGHGFSSIDLLLGTKYGISIYNISLLAVYYVVISVIVLSSLILGKRGFCHTFCWMAPFMVIGRKLSNRLNIKALRLCNDTQIKCNNCHQCEKSCPMSLPITNILTKPNIEHPDCILCGECVNTCKQKKLTIKFKKINNHLL